MRAFWRFQDLSPMANDLAVPVHPGQSRRDTNTVRELYGRKKRQIRGRLSGPGS